MQFLYLGALLISIAGLALLDRRFKLAFWYAPKRAALTILAGVIIFLIWDIAGIALGIFLHGDSSYSLPFTLAPEFPIEEVFFLTLLCYSALIIYRGVETWRSRI